MRFSDSTWNFLESCSPKERIALILKKKTFAPGDIGGDLYPELASPLHNFSYTVKEKNMVEKLIRGIRGKDKKKYQIKC